MWGRLDVNVRLGNLLYIYGGDDGCRRGKLACLGGNAEMRLSFWS